VAEFIQMVIAKGLRSIYQDGTTTTTLQDTEEEIVVEATVAGFSACIIQIRDVAYHDRHSYRKSKRSKQLEGASHAKMTAVEGPMDRSVETLLMAKRMLRGEAPSMPMHRATEKKPKVTENRKQWYSGMRHETGREFWVKTTRGDRDALRLEAKHPGEDLADIVSQIQRDDKSRSNDPFWKYQRDELAASDPAIYAKLDQDIVMFLDRNSKLLVCKTSGLFQLLLGSKIMDKVLDGVRKWTSLPSLPLPDTVPHAVDEYIRQQHPEVDLERARTLEELEARFSCVVHYGVWAMKGHTNPSNIWKTPDTLLYRYASRKVQENYPMELMPTFTIKVLGLGSEVARFLLSNAAPKEYGEAVAVFRDLPAEKKVVMSEPTFATLMVLGVNSFASRHSDDTDVKFGFASLVALGDYSGKLDHGALVSGDLRITSLTLHDCRWRPGLSTAES
jgi:hypothetical protein